MDNKNEQVLKEHKRMMIFTGKISDFQLKNLNLYPLMVFDSIESSSVKYDLDPKQGTGTVFFEINLKKIPRDKERRTQDIQRWTKHLLFDRVEVLVKITKVKQTRKTNGRKSTKAD